MRRASPGLRVWTFPPEHLDGTGRAIASGRRSPPRRMAASWRRWRTVGGRIYTSTDQRGDLDASGKQPLLVSITSSADGQAGGSGSSFGQIYTSTDSGVDWTARDSDRAWLPSPPRRMGTSWRSCRTAALIYTSSDSGGPGRLGKPTATGISRLLGGWQQAGGDGVWRPDLHLARTAG